MVFVTLSNKDVFTTLESSGISAMLLPGRSEVDFRQ